METYWVWEYGLFEKNPKRQDSLNPETTLEVIKAADAQATIAALQADPYKQGFIDALEKVASDWASKEFRGHDEIQGVEVQAFLDTRHVHYEECRGMKPLQSQLTQCTAKLEALQRERDKWQDIAGLRFAGDHKFVKEMELLKAENAKLQAALKAARQDALREARRAISKLFDENTSGTPEYYCALLDAGNALDRLASEGA